MKKSPHALTREGRLELARARAKRRQALLDQAESLRQEVAQLARDCAAAAFGPGDEPRQERVGALLFRMEAACAALHMAREILRQDDPSTLGEWPSRLQAALGRWSKASAGWWEARFVRRPRVMISEDRATGAIHVEVTYRTFGPYFYRHWREDGKQHSRYYGKEPPDDYPADEDVPEPPPPQPVLPASLLSCEAAALVERLRLLVQSAQEEQRQRLRRTLRVAGRRLERRLRADHKAGMLFLADDVTASADVGSSAPPPILQPRPPLPAETPLGADPQVLARLADADQALFLKTQVRTHVCEDAYGALLDALAELHRLNLCHALLAQAMRLHAEEWIVLLEPTAHHGRIAEVLARAAEDETVPSFRARVEATMANTQPHTVVRGAVLGEWSGLTSAVLRELQRVSGQVEARAASGKQAGVPVLAWLAYADAA
ncbi:MAG: hypothetical protein EI684_05280 [Candidatus Viridilinea halotolerans]|uniref:Uncharacterized protein n=1 Tax=Candidatus Viridilinea halotolerans TaxID=2491704 RepID=A0A426U5G8_9CHLR|nr:MAG: hypothetical protein EI684_05280 [Candidatus Viridilinea halotolerans]